MFHCFFSSLARSKHLSNFSLSFIFTLWSAAMAKFTKWLLLFFVLINTSLLTGVWWSVYISKSEKILCIPFSLTDSGLCIYHVSEWTNFNLLHNSHWITFLTQSSMVLYSFCVSLLHSLIIHLFLLLIQIDLNQLKIRDLINLMSKKTYSASLSNLIHELFR